VTAPESLPATVLRRAQATPDRVALRKKHLGRWRTYTWRDYAERVSAVAAGLHELGVGPGDRVAVLGDNRPAWVFADLGAQALGATTVGLDPDATATEVAALLREARAKVLVAEDEEQVDKALEVRAKLRGLQRIVVIDPRGVDVADDLLVTLAELEAQGRASSFDVASSAAAVDGAVRAAATAGVDERTEILSTLSLSGAFEHQVVVVDAVSQGAVVSFGENLETFPQDLREVQPTFFHAPAVLWAQIRSGAEERMADAGLLKRLVYRWGMSRGSTGGRGPLYALGWLALYRPLRQKLGLLRATGVVSGAAPLAPEVRDWYGTLGVPVRDGNAA
jgi:long-chain acyl-CoA synthetase